MTTALEKIRGILENEDDFLITAHYNPDGDALGSMVAVAHILSRLGKRFQLYNESGMPRQFDWLELPEGKEISTTVPNLNGCWTISLDCGDQLRLGREMAERLVPERTINIDHHLANPEFGLVNWVDVDQSSVGEMIGILALEMGMPLDGGLAEAVYLAMVTDTGFFVYGNTRPETHELAARLIREGLDAGAVNDKIRNQWTLRRITLWNRVLNSLEISPGGEVVMGEVYAHDMEETGTSAQDSEGVVSFIRRIRGVKVAALLREDGPKKIKISLRSQGHVDVRAIAATFGGGGHRNAAGATLEYNIFQAKHILMKAVSNALKTGPSHGT